MYRILFSRGDAALSVFDVAVTEIVRLSLLGTVFLLAGFSKSFWQSLFDSEKTPDYSWLTITAGVLLMSGMVHTQYTNAPVQFVAYGALIVAMILQTVLNVKEKGDAFRHWFSLAYIVVFSMAIPVMYHSDVKYHTLFHVIEGIAAIVLVVMFTIELRRIFTGDAVNLLRIVPFVAIGIFDSAIIALRWPEMINWFLLIFAVLSKILYGFGKVLFARIRK